VISRWWSKLSVWQTLPAFKIGATIAVALAAAFFLLTYSVANAKARSQALSALGPAEAAPAQPAEGADAKADQPRPVEAIDASRRVFENLVRSQYSIAGVAIGTLVVSSFAVGAIWLNVGLGAVTLGLCCALALGLVKLVDVSFGTHWFRTAAPIFIGLAALTASFVAVLRLLHMVLSAGNPVTGIARNVLTEAVRMRVWLIFILFLIFGLAALPLTLEDDQPLRYRVQSFLQFATGGAFWVIALLVVVFSVATVAFEQRSKVIWQTATKPVAAWQYVLGKWLGLAALSFALLSVTASGIFLFTEYLRRQPAIGEKAAFTVEGAAEELITEDRFLLETRVLTARETKLPDLPQINPEGLEGEIRQRVEAEFQRVKTFGTTPEEERDLRLKLETDVRRGLLKSVLDSYRVIGPGEAREFVFSGLQKARDGDHPLILEYSFEAGSSMPDQTHGVTVFFPNTRAVKADRVPLKQTLTLQLLPDAIDGNGDLRVQFANLDMRNQQTDGLPLVIPSENGLRLSYSTSSFTANFFRLMFVLWIKLLFLAMVGVVCATFLSFSVALLVAMTVFWAAESARFLLKAVENFETQSIEGKTLWFNVAIANVGNIVGRIFSTYADLKPTTRLVEGQILAWGSLVNGVFVLTLWTLVLFGVGVLIFRRRELATYSGH